MSGKGRTLNKETMSEYSSVGTIELLSSEISRIIIDECVVNPIESRVGSFNI